MLNMPCIDSHLTPAVIALLDYTSHVMGSDFSKLKAALKRAGMTQSDLARDIGVTRGAVSMWIGNKATPSLGHLLAISKALNMTISEILGDDAVVAETRDERQLLQTLRDLDEAQRQQLVTMARFLAAEKTKVE